MTPRFIALSAALFLVAASAAAAQTRQTMGEAFEKKDKKEKKSAPAAAEWSPEDRRRLMGEVTGEVFSEAMKAKKAGRLSEAQTLFERVMILDPSNAAARAHLVEIKRRLDSASKPAKKAPQNATAKLLGKLWNEADAAARSGDWDDAQIALKRILAIEPANKKAREKFEAAKRNLFATLKMRGEDREKAGDMEGALDAYQLALTHGDDPAVVDRIDRIKNKMSASNRKKSDDLYVAALSASQQGNNEKARTLCRHALRLNPTNLQAQRMLERLEKRLR